MKEYLLPSLENQSCKDFKWILVLGNTNNISYINSLLNFNNSFEYEILYLKELKNYIKNITNGFDVLITTRLDYDDRIYYDAVNDVRKAINIEKPMLLYGYGMGVYYYELDGKYYEFNSYNMNDGIIGIFVSLITILKNVNDSYSILDLGSHETLRKTLLNNYTYFGIKKLDYEPAIFDSGTRKFVYVRQNLSSNYNNTLKKKNKLKEISFNLSDFYGK